MIVKNETGRGSLSLKTLIVVLLLAWTPVFGTPQARSRRRVPPPAAESVVGIEVIDFENYTYTLNGRSYKLVGGFYARGIAPEGQWELQVVEVPYYGDLTGDGRNEAVVVLRYGAVGGPHTVEARVYTLRGATPVLLTTFPIADSLNCDLDHYVDLDDGKLRIERLYGRAARCDHNEIREYRWDGSRFMPIGDARTMPCRCM
jgi:hypothetical protein